MCFEPDVQNVVCFYGDEVTPSVFADCDSDMDDCHSDFGGVPHASDDLLILTLMMLILGIESCT